MCVEGWNKVQEERKNTRRKKQQEDWGEQMRQAMLDREGKEVKMQISATVFSFENTI